jgi:hypothetical protein
MLAVLYFHNIMVARRNLTVELSTRNKVIFHSCVYLSNLGLNKSYKIDKRFGVFRAVNIQIEVFWVVTPYGRIQTFRRSLLPEDGDSIVSRNVCILPQHYTASQSRRPWFESFKLMCNELLFILLRYTLFLILKNPFVLCFAMWLLFLKDETWRM